MSSGRSKQKYRREPRGAFFLVSIEGMEELGAKIYWITEESFSLVDNYLTRDDLDDIRIGKLSAVAGVIEDTVDGVMLFEVKDNRALLIHGISVASNVDRAYVREQLIKWATKVAKDNGWIGICSFTEDEEIENIFRKYGFFIEESESTDFTVSFKEVKSLRYYYETKIPNTIYDGREITRRILNSFINNQENNGLFKMSYKPTKLQKYAVRGDDICGCIIGHVSDNGDCLIDYVYIDESAVRMFLPLLKSFINEVAETRKTEFFNIKYTAVNQASLSITKKILGDKALRIQRKTAII